MHKPGASSCKKLGWTIELSRPCSRKPRGDMGRGRDRSPSAAGVEYGEGLCLVQKKNPLLNLFYAFWVVLTTLLSFCSSLRNNRWQTGVLDMLTPWCHAPGAKCITSQCFWHPACLSVDLYAVSTLSDAYSSWFPNMICRPTKDWEKETRLLNITTRSIELLDVQVDWIIGTMG